MQPRLPGVGGAGRKRTVEEEEMMLRMNGGGVCCDREYPASKMAASMEFSLEDLPSDPLLLILSFLDFRDLIR